MNLNKHFGSIWEKKEVLGVRLADSRRDPFRGQPGRETPKRGLGKRASGGSHALHTTRYFPFLFLFLFCFNSIKKKIFFWKFWIYSWPEGLTSWLWGLTKLTIRVNLCFIFGHMNLYDLIKISYEISQRFSFVDI